MEEGVVGATELLDAEVVVVDEALEGFRAILHRAHFDAAPHAVEGHGDHGVTGLPTDGAVLGIVDDRPNARLGLDEGLVPVGIVLRREVVDGDVLVEIVSRVSFAFGSGAVSHLAYARGRMYSDVIVGVGLVLAGGKLVADAIGILTVVDKNTTADEEGSSPL